MQREKQAGQVEVRMLPPGRQKRCHRGKEGYLSREGMGVAVRV